MIKEIIGGRSSEDLPYSKAVRAGDFIYVSGMVALGPDGVIIKGGVAAETHAIFNDLKALLDEAGCGLEQVVKSNVCLPVPGDFDEFNEAYAEYFTENHPARATICAALTIPARVEIEFIVYDPRR